MAKLMIWSKSKKVAVFADKIIAFHIAEEVISNPKEPLKISTIHALYAHYENKNQYRLCEGKKEECESFVNQIMEEYNHG